MVAVEGEAVVHAEAVPIGHGEDVVAFAIGSSNTAIRRSAGVAS
ncbi:hypothetical protein [Corynebacterium dentalis]|nr:hypothetical protein [Corynebacterium dentalis]